MADNIFACKTAYSNVIDLADNTDSYIKSGSLTTWQILLCLITEERIEMETLQREILNELNILR